jgi:hypothetical protein
MPPTHDKMARFLLPAIAALVCFVVALSAVNAIAAMAHINPHIGDIVSFAPSDGAPSADQPVEPAVRLIVHRPNQFGCILDLNVLRRSGGSVVVESQVTEAVGSFRVHWAGTRTSADNANCGTDTDLILDGQELNILAVGAGGYGAGPKHLPPFAGRPAL